MPIPSSTVRGTPETWRPMPKPVGAACETAGRLDRDARFPQLIDVAPNLAARLRALVVIVVGAGSIGMRVIDALARMGIRGLWICDGRNTKAESLLTHPVGPDEIGVPKAELAARQAKGLSPETDVRSFAGPFEDLPRDALAGADCVVIATDNPAAEVSVTQACLHLGLDHLQASVYGRALVATVRTLTAGASRGGPCLACGFSLREWSDLDRGTRFSCDGGAEPSAAPDAATLATASLPHLCALAASLAVGELVRTRLGLGPEADVGRSLEICGYDGRTVRTRLTRNPECPLDHSVWSVRTSDTPLDKLTPRDLARIAGIGDHQLASTSIEVDGHRFVGLAACECVEHLGFGRFLRVAGGSRVTSRQAVEPTDGGGASFGVELGRCPDCGGGLVPHPMYTHSETPWGSLGGCLDRNLGELGAGAAPTVLVRAPHGTTLVRPPASARPLPSAGGALIAPEPGDPKPSQSEDFTPRQEVPEP